MQYIVRIETRFEGRSTKENLTAVDREDANHIARRLRSFSSDGTSKRPYRTCTVCVRIQTSIGVIIVPADKARLVADEIYATLPTTLAVAVDED